MCEERKRGATLELQRRGIRTVGLTVRHGVPYGTFLTASEQSRSLCVFGSGRYLVGLVIQAR